MYFTNYSQVLEHLDTLIVSWNHPIGQRRRERTRYLFSLIGNPQDQLKIIHIAGTSGKWWTASILSQILHSTTDKTIWLHVSPHLIDMRERIQINNALVDTQTVVNTFNILYPAIQQVSDQTFFWTPTYYEVTIALMYMIFAYKKVDYAIVEVGVGWLYDGTNMTDHSKYCIITRQWYDHMEIVGEQLADITRNDAWIITPGSTVITLHHHEQVCNDIIDYRCHTTDSQKNIFDPKNNLIDITYTQKETTFSFTYKDKTMISLTTNLLGPFHLENIGMALTAYHSIAEQEQRNYWILDRDILKHLQRRGRFDLQHYHEIDILLDGAHNVQKMDALITSLFSVYWNQQWKRYIAFKQGKQRQEMCDLIIPYAEHITIGNFSIIQDSPIRSVTEDEIANYLTTKWYTDYTISNDITTTLQSYADTKKPLIITGSLYFLSKVYQVMINLEH